jgi:hypothetical protein
MVTRIAFVAFLPLLAVVNVSAQMVAAAEEPTCHVSGTVTVSVTDLSGAVIQNAFVLFRADRSGTSNAKPFQLELRANSAGRATASLPCGYIDFFVAADGFTPHAAKLLVEQSSSSAPVRLNVYPITQR